MKRSKRIYMLLGVFAVICAVTAGVVKYEEHKEVIKNSDEVILKVEGDSVTSLSWSYDSESMAFHKNDSEWLYDEDEKFPVDEDKVQELLEVFQEFGVSFIIEDVEDYAQYGLDNPTCTINMETEDEDYEILVGNYSEMDEERYVSIGDGNVYLVKDDPMGNFEITLKDMIKQDEAPEFETVTGIRFEGNEEYQITYEEDSSNTYCEDDVYFTERDGETLPLDTESVDTYLQAVSELSLKDYVTYNVTDEELKTYGLDNPELTLTVDYVKEAEDEESEGEKASFTMSISRDPEEIKEAEKEDTTDEDSDEEEITAYVRIGESQIVYKVAADSYRSLMDAGYDSLRHQEVLSVDYEDIEQIDISLEGKVYTLTSEKEKDERVYSYEGEEIDISDFRSSLRSLTADSFTEEEPEQKEEISLTVTLDDEDHSKILVQLYRYDGEHCLAVVAGEPISLVDRSEVVDLIETVNAIVLN